MMTKKLLLGFVMALTVLAPCRSWGSGGTFCLSGEYFRYGADMTGVTHDIITDANALCTASKTPWDCCTGNTTGVCDGPRDLPKFNVAGLSATATTRLAVTAPWVYPNDASAASAFTCTATLMSSDSSPDSSHTVAVDVGLEVAVPEYSSFKGEDLRVPQWQHGVSSAAAISTVKYRGKAYAAAAVTPKTMSYNAGCTAADTPWDCCTGNTTGNCPATCDISTNSGSNLIDCRQDYMSVRVEVIANAGCTANLVPWGCCTGSGTGTCGTSTSGTETLTQLCCSYS